jgi:hypothetical protein
VFGELEVMGEMPSQARDEAAQRIRGVKALPLLTWTLALCSGCAYILGGTVDYVFAVAGTVTAADGTPIEGCAVTLEVGDGVYQGVQPIRQQSETTNIYGGFQFTYITHRHNMPYQLRFKKDGYVAYTVRGVSPPRSTHNVTLQPVKTTAGNGNASPRGGAASPNNAMQLTRGGWTRVEAPSSATRSS